MSWAGTDSDRPLLLFGRQEHDRGRDAVRVSFPANHCGPKLQLKITGATHATVIEFAVLVLQAAPILNLQHVGETHPLLPLSGCCVMARVRALNRRPAYVLPPCYVYQKPTARARPGHYR